MEGSVALARSNLGRLLLVDLEESLLCIPRRESGDNDAMSVSCLLMAQLVACDKVSPETANRSRDERVLNADGKVMDYGDTTMDGQVSEFKVA